MGEIRSIDELSESEKLLNKIADKSSMLMVKAKCFSLHDNQQKVLEDMAELIDNIYDIYELLLKEQIKETTVLLKHEGE